MFKPGSIRKIVVENFVTYSYVEMYPGPNLNMLIGPNGTGKSTVVAAIILGLGGNPKTVGRGAKVSDYIKHNCTDAKIHIFLQKEIENVFVKVTREFDLDEKNVWRLDDKRVTAKDVIKFIRQYDIQVDNLCQFLPQDRVQDFAKMNKQELLKQTVIALCRPDLIEKQENLISNGNRQKQLAIALDKYGQRLQETVDSNARLEARVKNFRTKKLFNDQIKNIDRKIAWVSYNEYKTRIDDIAKDKHQATRVYENHMKAMEPLRNGVKNAKSTMDIFQHKISKIGRCCRQEYNKVQNEIENCKRLKLNMQQIESDKKSKLAEINRNVADLRNLTARIEELKEERASITAKHNVHDLDQQLNESNREITTLVSRRTILQDKIDDVMQHKLNLNAEVRAFENELSQLQNVKQQRLQLLRRLDPHAYEAVIWLNSNRHLFKGEVYGPMLLEINVLNPNHSIFIENIINVGDRIAFTCVLIEDMNLLIKLLRGQQKLNVNIVHSPKNDGIASQSYRPQVPLENLMRYGFYAYANSLFTAPEPIMKYLCKTYHIHSIPVGSDKINSCFQDVPKEVKLFFSSDTKYSILYSKYSGEKNICQNDIRANGSLSISLNAVRIETIEGEISEIRRSCAKLDTQINNLKLEVEQLDGTVLKIRNNIKSNQEIKQHFYAIEKKVKSVTKEFQQMEKSVKSPDDIDLEATLLKKDVIKQMVEMQNVIKNAYKKYTNLMVEHKKENINLSVTQKELELLTSNLEEQIHLSRESKQILENISQRYNLCKAELQLALQKVKNLSNGLGPNQEGFDELMAEVSNLSNNLEELESEKEQITARIDCLHIADDREMEEYEERERLINELRTSLERGNVELDNLTGSVERLQEDWIMPLKDLVEKINERFGLAFRSMGCVGEVSVCSGDDEKDYANYGISIKVTYRDGEPLQELNMIVQSGGERAVATAVFMLSLQELTPVPFRCVDEINQGMDANNERRIFELLVSSTSRPNTSQYFLITPKLVPNLKYVGTMMIHVVHNGPFLTSSDKWKNANICNPQEIEIN